MQTQDDIKINNYGRMVYHPDFHFNHGKKFTEAELEYLCKFWESDGRRVMSYALGKTEVTLQQKVNVLRKQGKFEYYKNLNKYW